MLTWIRLWPAFVFPVLVLNLIGFLPTLVFQGDYVGGGPVREWAVNTFLLPVLSVLQAEQIVLWFNQATVMEECFLYGVIVLNLDVLMMPVFYGLGNILMKISNWISIKELQLKRSAARVNT
ncbi:MAG: hypothetical protein ACE5FY_05925 [Nitrospiria bacterium]